MIAPMDGESKEIERPADTTPGASNMRAIMGKSSVFNLVLRPTAFIRR